MVEKNIAILEGDGIGPEIMREGLKVLDAVSSKYGHKFNLVYASFGAQACFDEGHPFPERTRILCDETDSVLKGPIGVGPEETKILNAAGIKLENDALLPLRAQLDTFANYRPVYLPKSIVEFSPLKPEIVGEGIDILMMRELVGGIYFGEKVEGVELGQFTRDNASDECRYDRAQVERFAHVCFQEARKKESKLTNVQKPNILATGRFWNAIFEGTKDTDGSTLEKGIKDQYPDVPYNSMIVDNVAYQLVVNPTQFNGVMALENMQGDILTDQAGGLLGSLGLMPSACFNPETGKGYFEPAHGSAPTIAGQNVANPYSMIGSVAFMLDKSFGLEQEAKNVWDALIRVFAKGYKTRELSKGDLVWNSRLLSTSEFGDMVRDNIFLKWIIL